IDADRGVGHGLAEAQEVLVLADEVGFAVDLDDGGAVALLGEGDAAFGGDTVGLLVGLGQARLAQRFGGGVDVAAGLGERLLALHHAGAGALAQFLDQGCGDFHWGPRDLWVFKVRGRAWWRGRVSGVRCRAPYSAASALPSVASGLASVAASAASGFASAALASVASGFASAASAFLRAGARRGFSPSAESLNSSSRTVAALGAAALPSSTASAAARAYSCTARMAS